MKKLLNIITVLLLAVISTSCLNHGLEELDTYDECDITAGEIYWRYYGTDIIPGSGEVQVKQVRLRRANVKDDETNTFHIQYLTDAIPEAERDNFTQEKAVVAVSISTAAIIAPIGDAPKLGVPGDWSKANQYQVTAADGTQKTWTIVVEPYHE